MPEPNEQKPDLSQKSNESTLPADFTPRTKTDWERLAKENPARFVELSQPRIDELTRKEREATEKLTAAEQREQNLLQELAKYKTPAKPETEEGEDQPKEYGNGVYPQTEKEWDDLFIERPAFAADLRNEFVNKKRAADDDFVTSRRKAAQTVWTEHPDMYIFEVDANGETKKDEHGKPVLKINPDTGTPIFNPESEKGKLWTEVWNQDPHGWSRLKEAPSLMMLKMEQLLREKGNKVVQDANAQNDSSNVNPSALAPQGVTPPARVTLRFSSDEERALAEKSVQRGTYKSLEDYCQWRDRGSHTFDHEDSRPDFSKK